MWNYVYAVVFFLSFLLSILLVPFFKKASFLFHVFGRNFIDYPSSRKVHSKPMPLLGGLGIFFSILFTIIIGLCFKKYLFFRFSQYYNGIIFVLPKLFEFLIASCIVVFFGLLDDLYHFRSFHKLFFQIIAGTLIYLIGFRINIIPFPVPSFFLTVFWIILCMNSFNFLDHMDGLSSGIAFIAGTIFFLSSVTQGQLFVATLVACFLGAVFGFLLYNFPPAGIFMGESGSSFIGYFLGVVSIMATCYHYKPSQSFLPVFTPLIILSLPFFDTISVVIIRLKNKKPISHGDKNHISHRLIKLGMTKKQAILFCYLLTFVCGMPVIFLYKLNVLEGSLVVFQVILILICAIILENAGSKQERKNV